MTFEVFDAACGVFAAVSYAAPRLGLRLTNTRPGRLLVYRVVRGSADAVAQGTVPALQSAQVSVEAAARSVFVLKLAYQDPAHPASQKAQAEHALGVLAAQ